MKIKDSWRKWGIADSIKKNGGSLEEAVASDVVPDNESEYTSGKSQVRYIKVGT